MPTVGKRVAANPKPEKRKRAEPKELTKEDMAKRTDLSNYPIVKELKQINIHQSGMSSAEKCYGQFHFRILAQKGIITRFNPRTWPGTIYGTTLHNLTEIAVSERFRFKAPIRDLLFKAAADFERVFFEEKARVKKEGYTIGQPRGYNEKEFLPQYKACLVTFIAHILTTYFGDDVEWPIEVHTELYCEIHYSTPEIAEIAPFPVFLGGTIDLVLIYEKDGKKWGIIIDYKTTKERQKFEKADRTRDPQSMLYTWFFEQKFGFAPESFDYKIIDILSNEVYTEPYPSFSDTMELNRRIIGILRKIGSPNPLTFFFPSKSHCNLCNYSSVCAKYAQKFMKLVT